MGGCYTIKFEVRNKKTNQGVWWCHSSSLQLRVSAIQRGELLGIIGPNGSGKTTLVNLMTGFVKPTSEISYNGQNISRMPAHKIIQLGIARTFQMVRPFYQLPAYKNMIIPLYSPRVKKLLGGRYGDRDAVALDLLEEVGLKEMLMWPTNLPGPSPGILKTAGVGQSHCAATRTDHSR